MNYFWEQTNYALNVFHYHWLYENEKCLESDVTFYL